jgi:hypothetical protein
MPSSRSEVLTARIRDAEICAERGGQIFARRQIAVIRASDAEATVVKTEAEVGGVVSAPQALSLFTHRIGRRCQVVVESDAFFKTAVIGSGFLSAILMIALLLLSAA